MLYRFDKKSLTFIKVNWFKRLIWVVVISIGILLLLNGSVKLDKNFTETQIMMIVAQHNQFSNDKLIKQIKEMHFQFPYIIYAQSLLETHNFTSNVFLENQNLFGMKLATKRINLANGFQGDYAYYNYWMDSLYDYGLYCATYLSKLKTEDDYYNYLSQFYAEDGLYISKLKSLVQKEDLKSKFNQ